MLITAFIVCVCLVVSTIGTLLSEHPVRVSIPLTDQTVVDGTLGRDPEGVWLTGRTLINVLRFTDSPWRSMSWRWHTPPGDPLVVTIQLERTVTQVTAPVQWRVVHLLMPAATTRAPLQLRSDTRTVSGDSRALGVIIDQFEIHELPLSDLQKGLALAEYAILIAVAAWWLARAQWLGFAMWLGFSALVVVLIAQEAALGFSHTTLLLDRSGRWFCIVYMTISAWRQRKRVITDVPPTGRRLGLDIMRAVAVLCVVAAHVVPLLFREWATTRDVFRWFVYFGGLGVDIFFALSGYLIGGIVLRIAESFADFTHVKRFWQRRWLRTLPAAYVSAAVVWLVAPPTHLLDYVRSLLFVGAVHPYFISQELTFWWSLATEEMFYLLLPLALWFVLNTTATKKPFLVTIGAFATVTLLGRIVVQLLVPSTALGGLEMTSIDRLDSMIWGILIQWVRLERPHWFRTLAQIGYAPGLACASIGFLLLLDQTRWYTVAMLLGHTLIVCGAALVIPAFEHVTTLGWRPLDRLFHGIALISFSVFLYHKMMQQFLTAQFGVATTWPELAGLIGAYLALTFLAATISYFFVEVPALRFRETNYPDESAASRTRS